MGRSFTQARGRLGSGIAIVLKWGNSGISFFIRPMQPQIKESLISLMHAIKRSDGPVIAGEMERLDGLLESGRAAGALHPQLEHFLEKRSYAKALQYLGGETLQNQGFPGRPANPAEGCDAKPKPAAIG
jgi:hypothetical protein